MKKIKQLGVWMDHSNALFIELSNHMFTSKKITIKSTQPEEDNRDEYKVQLHNKEHHHNQAAFYKEMSDIIRNYDDVLLFGPTDAKNELFNLLRADHHFENIKIELKTTDKMTENEIHEFVLEYFK